MLPPKTARRQYTPPASSQRMVRANRCSSCSMTLPGPTGLRREAIGRIIPLTATLRTRTMEQELALTGGRTTTGVVRIGNTVHRPIGARAAFVHALLRHLRARAFDGAPRFLGVDSVGREVLSFLPGSVPPDLGGFSDSQLVAAAIGNDDLSVDHQGRRVADFFLGYGLEPDGAISSIIAAQRALAARTDSANVRPWSDSCRQWVECNRDRLSTAIATACPDARSVPGKRHCPRSAGARSGGAARLRG